MLPLDFQYVRDSRCRWTLAVWLLATVAGAQPVVVQPVVPTQHRVPAKGVSTSSGLFVQMSTDALGAGQFGYRSLTYQFQSNTPLTSDTQITVRAYVSDWNNSRYLMSAEADAEMLAGQTQATLVLRLPQYNEWTLIWWDVWVDGGHDGALSIDRTQPRQFSDTTTNRWQQESLLVWDANPRLLGIATQLLAGADGSNGNAFPVKTERRDLSRHWLDYTPYDVVTMETSVLLAKARQDPEAITALKKWLRAGGNLWVQSVGEDWNQLAAVNEIFDWPVPDEAIVPTTPEGNQPPGTDEWSYAFLSGKVSGDEKDGLVQDFGSEATNPPTPSGEATQEVDPAYSEDWFAVRRFGWGTVAAFPTSDWNAAPSDLTQSQRAGAAGFWMMRAWPARHGLVPGMANVDFSNWLIPGVGLAPVVEFQILITLFVLGIGPLNYWLLKRVGRLHLMVLTVPAVALAITAALLAYGLLSDGFDTQVRTQSITLVDGQKGEAATWSRLSYYSAFAPNEGLTFSDDTAIYAIEPGSNEAYDLAGQRRQRDIVWTDTEQRLHSGWLASRTPTQYLAIEPRKLDSPVTIQRSQDTATINHTFDAEAQLVVVIDHEGRWYLGEDVASGNLAALVPTTRPDAVAAVREELSGREPEFPDAYASAQDSPLLYEQQRQRRRRFRQNMFDYALTGASQSLLQRRWQELLGFAGGDALDLTPGSYLIISDAALLPPSRDEFLVEDSSVHLVIGTY